jgi:hypothetical protein
MLYVDIRVGEGAITPVGSIPFISRRHTLSLLKRKKEVRRNEK